MLQRFLIERDTDAAVKKLGDATSTGYFCIFTRDALAEYQRASGIEPTLGFYGPLTREDT